jgi:hypothetical protein
MTMAFSATKAVGSTFGNFPWKETIIFTPPFRVLFGG